MLSDRSSATSTQQRGEVVVGDDAAVDGEDERLLAELRDVVQDAAQVGELHRQPRIILSRAAGPAVAARPSSRRLDSAWRFSYAAKATYKSLRTGLPCSRTLARAPLLASLVLAAF